MINWLGQMLEVGDAVYRGAREGNGSTYKVGFVSKLNEDTQKVTVTWLYEPGNKWIKEDVHQLRLVTQTVPCPVRTGYKLPSVGTSNVNTLVQIDWSVVGWVEEQMNLSAEEYGFVSDHYRPWPVDLTRP